MDGLQEADKLLRQFFINANIKLSDMDGFGRHFKLEISASEFAGKSRLEQHRLVNSALKGLLGTDKLHSLLIVTQVKE